MGSKKKNKKQDHADAHEEAVPLAGELWDVEFYENEDGREPAAEFLDGLGDSRRNAAVAALEEVLAVDGTDICNSEWGKNLGEGLYELRVRHTAVRGP